MTQPAPAFDALAGDYDARFSRSTLGRLVRRAVWRWLDACFQAGDRVLELNCGTGEDAVHLARRGVRVVATDASSAMADLARRKVADAGLAGLVRVAHASIEQVAAATADEQGAFDGMVSNFGGLNCVAQLDGVARGLAERVRPGARVVLCVMGPLVPWEWGWFLWRGEPRRMFRRLRTAGVEWRGVSVRYPTVRRLRRVFGRSFAVRRIGAVGFLLPPTYLEPWAARHPRFVERLDAVERRVENWPLLPWLADHYVMELERR